jgi:meso-butanediol dehydrogenase/(S,S)-butanediol dehydrogenase/diacetyl reductase
VSSGLLSNAVVFLTGGAQGIGRECALAYAREGAHVAIADTNLESAEQTRAELATEGLVVGCDVGDGASVAAAIATVLEHFGRLDAVHNKPFNRQYHHVISKQEDI